MWALGVTLYCMIFNKLPFWDETEYGLFQRIHKEDVKLGEHRQLSPGLKTLVFQMLEKDPEKRVTSESLRHNSWLNEGSKHPLFEDE